ncbi:response regulator transcription factor [bacterium]|nr:response regulator transcription factor [bacterium]
MIKIILVDDHELVREGIKKVLKKETDIDIVGETPNSAGLNELLQKVEADLVILDISLPDRSGLEVLKDLKIRYPKLRVLMLSMHPEERFAIRAIRSGASGYVTKDMAAQELVKAVQKIMSGRKYVSTNLAEHMAAELDTPSEKPPHEVLSDREFEVLRLIASGKKLSEIADHLLLSVNTVTTYRARILEKMNMKSNVELIRYALENHIVE